MNHLNSFLIEGVIAKTPEYSEEKKQCIFTIESYRFTTANGEARKKVNIFTVIANGKNAKECSEKKKGNYIRVVGRLDYTKDNAVFLEAENIEFKQQGAK